MSIGSTSVCHIAILVKDIEKAAANWAALLGLEQPPVWSFPPETTVPSFTDGKPGRYDDTRLAVFQLDNVKIELVEPGRTGPWRESLEKNGEGLQHLSFIVPDRKAANKTLRELGAGRPYHIGYWPDGTYSFTDSIRQLGIEINIKTDEDNTEKIKAVSADPGAHLEDLK